MAARNGVTVALTFKESDRHWEEGEYQPIRLQGYPVQTPWESNSRTVEQSEKLAKVPKREFIRPAHARRNLPQRTCTSSQTGKVFMKTAQAVAG